MNFNITHKTKVIAEKPIQIPHCSPVNPLSVTLKASFPNCIKITCKTNSNPTIRGKNIL